MGDVPCTRRPDLFDALLFNRRPRKAVLVAVQAEAAALCAACPMPCPTRITAPERVPARKPRAPRVWAPPLPPGPMLRETCGTLTGYNQHRQAGETTCRPCRDAKAAWFRGWAAAHREQERQRHRDYYRRTAVAGAVRGGEPRG